MSSWLLCRARLFKRSRKFGLDSCVVNPPSQMPVSPAGSYCAWWCAPGGASKRSRSRRTPSTTDCDDHLQSWVQCVRVCSDFENCCERPAWLWVRTKLDQCHSRSSLCHHYHPRWAPLGSNGTWNFLFSTEIGFVGRLNATWFLVGVLHFSCEIFCVCT